MTMAMRMAVMLAMVYRQDGNGNADEYEIDEMASVEAAGTSKIDGVGKWHEDGSNV